MKKKLMAGGIWTIILILLDQITKLLAQSKLAGTYGSPVIPGVFEFFYLENRGAAFGMLKNQQWIFILIALIMMLIGAFFYIKSPSDAHYRPLRMICVMIMAGAIGNMIDRFWHQYVIDFIYVKIIEWPVFNVADCYVCVGAVLAVLLMFTYYKEDDFAWIRH